nr:hypothetical protein [Wenxinia marina]
MGVALSGLGLGLTASRQLMAGGFVPVRVPLSMPQLNAWIGWVHGREFCALSALTAVHAAFHVWRHVRLRDNALRIMAPRWDWRWL